MEPLDETDLDLEQLSRDVADEIRAFEAKSEFLREERILHNAPPPPAATVKTSAASKVGWNKATDVPGEESTAGTNFEELD